jgi:hypothetical protein
MSETVYRCENDACPLGIPGHGGGLFTGGITKEGVTLLTANQEPTKNLYGEGICPNCGGPNGKKAAVHDPKKVAAEWHREQAKAHMDLAKKVSSGKGVRSDG